MTEELEKMKSDVLRTLPPAKVLIDELQQKSRQTLLDFVNGGYKKMLENINLYLEDENRRDEPFIQNAVQWAYMQADFFPVKEIAEIQDALLKEEEPFEIVNELIQENPILGRYVEYNFFGFNIFKKLHDLCVQRILREIDAQELAIALVGADEEVKNKILSVMSKRAGQMLQEDIVQYQFMDKAKIDAARNSIVRVIRHLEKNGDIVFP